MDTTLYSPPAAPPTNVNNSKIKMQSDEEHPSQESLGLLIGAFLSVFVMGRTETKVSGPEWKSLRQSSNVTCHVLLSSAEDWV